MEEGLCSVSHATSGRGAEASWEKRAWDLGEPIRRVYKLHPAFLLVDGDLPLSDFRKVNEEAQTQGRGEGKAPVLKNLGLSQGPPSFSVLSQ